MGAIKSVTLTENQSLFDVVLQYYGSVSRVYDFIKLNQDQIPNIMFNNLNGMTVLYEEQSNQVATYFKNNNRDFNGNIRPISTRFPQFLASPYSEEFQAAISPSFLLSLANVSTNPFSL